jgi:GNAT superfamily N-acetyltransferase
MPRIELATPGDLNFVRRAWCQDVTDASEIRVELRDIILRLADIVVLRPDDVPPDTIGAFIVLSPAKHIVHWAGTKRAWRGLGFGTLLLEHAESLGCFAFARFGCTAQKRKLEGRGWKYAPRNEALLAG